MRRAAECIEKETRRATMSIVIDESSVVDDWNRRFADFDAGDPIGARWCLIFAFRFLFLCFFLFVAKMALSVCSAICTAQ